MQTTRESTRESTRIEDVVERQRAGLRWQLSVAITLVTGVVALLLGV
jgi:hypothetical protein